MANKQEEGNISPSLLDMQLLLPFLYDEAYETTNFAAVCVCTTSKITKVAILVYRSDGLNTNLSNIEQIRTSFFEHGTNSNMFIY